MSKGQCPWQLGCELTEGAAPLVGVRSEPQSAFSTPAAASTPEFVRMKRPSRVWVRLRGGDVSFCCAAQTRVFRAGFCCMMTRDDALGKAREALGVAIFPRGDFGVSLPGLLAYDRGVAQSGVGVGAHCHADLPVARQPTGPAIRASTVNALVIGFLRRAPPSPARELISQSGNGSRRNWPLLEAPVSAGAAGNLHGVG